MLVDGVRDDLISRRAAWEALKQMHGISEGVGLLKMVGRGEGEMVDRDKVEYMLEEIDPASIQPPARIEAAIRFLEKEFDKIKTLNCPYGTYEELARNINLLKYLLNQPQNDMGYPGSTWADEELGLDKETTRSDAGTKN